MPVILVVTAVLAKVDRSNLQDLHGVLADAADGGASSLVDLGPGRPGLLRLGEGVGCDGAERQESHHRSRAVSRHFDSDLWLVLLGFGGDV